MSNLHTDTTMPGASGFRIAQDIYLNVFPLADSNPLTIQRSKQESALQSSVPKVSI